MMRSESLPRVFFDNSVELSARDRGGALLGRGTNISLGGMYIHCDEVLRKGTSVRVKLPLTPSTSVDLSAEVVRTNTLTSAAESRGMALRFGPLGDDNQTTLRDFIAKRLEPAVGDAVHIRLAERDTSIVASVQNCWDGMLAVEAELPFLRVGDPVVVRSATGQSESQGTIAWVSVRVCPDTGIPRLNIGFSLPSMDDSHAAESSHADPVHTTDFANHCRTADAEVRRRRRGSH